MARKLLLFAYRRCEAALSSYKCGTKAACYPDLVYCVDWVCTLLGV